ncbi:MAG: GAF domain-containing sensor histidine kinase [Armatimonas sp.]
METTALLIQRQESLRTIVESISSELHLRPLLTQIVRHACSLIGADNGTIGLVDERRDLVHTEATWNMPESELGAEMPRGVGLAGTVLATGEPLVLGRYGEVDAPTQPTLSENAVIGIPILWREKLIGVFGIGTDASRSKRRFTDDDVETLTLLARHAAIAIENARLFESAERALAETQLMYEASAKLSAAVSVDEVVAAYLMQVAGGGRHACTITRYERTDEQSEPTGIILLGRWSPDTGLDLRRHRHPHVRDVIDDLLEGGQTVAMANVHTDSRANKLLREIQKESGRPALALIPLHTRGRTRLGHVILSHEKVHVWEEDELHRFEITAAQLASALDSRFQQERLGAQSRQMAIFEERQRIARDLHDSVTQLLFSMTLIAQTAGAAWKRDPEEGERRTTRLVELSQTALAEMRALLAELRPPTPRPTGREALESQGLVTALALHLEALQGDGGPALTLDTRRYRRAAFAVEHALYRIAQEAIANARKHALASQMVVRLATTRAGATRMNVIDDGIGFTPGSPRVAPSGSGMGLSSMTERAAKVGGTLKVRSMPQKGTAIEVTVPVEAKEQP